MSSPHFHALIRLSRVSSESMPSCYAARDPIIPLLGPATSPSDREKRRGRHESPSRARARRACQSERALVARPPLSLPLLRLPSPPSSLSRDANSFHRPPLRPLESFENMYFALSNFSRLAHIIN